MSTGYSGTTLAKKLGIKDGCSLVTINPPGGYEDLLQPLPGGVTISEEIMPDADIIHLFTNSRDELSRRLSELRRMMKQNGSIWVSWYKGLPSFRPRSLKTPFAGRPSRSDSSM